MTRPVAVSTHPKTIRTQRKHTNQQIYRNSRILLLPKPTPPPTFNLYSRPFRPLACASEALKSNEDGYGCVTQGPCPHLMDVCISIGHMPAYRAFYVLLLVQRPGKAMSRTSAMGGAKVRGHGHDSKPSCEPQLVCTLLCQILAGLGPGTLKL